MAMPHFFSLFGRPQWVTRTVRMARSMRVVRPALCCTLALAVVSPASAMTIRELRALEKSDAKQGANYKRYYLVGAMEASVATHDNGVRAGATASICLNGRRLDPAMAEGLYQTELKRNQDLYEADMPVTLVMGNALSTVYPC
jgi:hypothetical protein